MTLLFRATNAQLIHNPLLIPDRVRPALNATAHPWKVASSSLFLTLSIAVIDNYITRPTVCLASTAPIAEWRR